MPKPPRETMGGFVDTLLSFDKIKLENDILIVNELTLTKEYDSYDEDFKTKVEKRLELMREYQNNIEALKLDV